MIDELNAEQTERVFAQPNEFGVFEEGDCETIQAWPGIDACLRLVEQADGWRGASRAQLANASESYLPSLYGVAARTRSEAIVQECERIIAWCADQKGDSHSKKHRKQAERLQDWALKVSRENSVGGSADANAQQADEIEMSGPSGLVEPGNTPGWNPGGHRFESDSLNGAAREGRPPAEDALSARTNSSSPGVQMMIPIDQVHEHPDNPRKLYAEGPLQELAESMRQGGFIPYKRIIAIERVGGGYFAVAGNRRRRAAIIAGLSEVPCEVCDLTPKQISDILNFDNLPGEQVHPLHEAAGWQSLIDKEGWSVQAIANRIGKGIGYVYKRLLVAGMIEDAKRAFVEGEITLGHAERIARGKSERDQQRILQACYPPEWNKAAGMLSTRDLDEWIVKNLHTDLKDACFPQASAELLPSAGSCDACPHRVGNLLDFDPLADMPNMCTQPACYESKVAAHIEAEKLRLTAEHGYLILLAERNNPREDGVLPHSEWHRAVSGDPKAKHGLMVDGPDAGRVRLVVIQERLPLAAEPQPEPELEELEDFEPEPAPAPAAKKPDTKKADAEAKAAQEREAQRMNRENAKRAQAEADAKETIARELAVRQQVLGAILERTEWPPSREGIEQMLEEWMRDMDATLDDLVSAQGASPVGGAQDWRKVSLQQLSRLVIIRLVCHDFEDYNLTHASKRLDAAAKRVGLDIDTLRKRATLEYAAQASGIDFESDEIEFKPGKTVLADIELKRERGGWFVTAGVHLPTKGSEGYGQGGPITPPKGCEVWKDRGEAFDAAFTWMTGFLKTVATYQGSTEATRTAADQVARWVRSGQAARAAILALNPPKDARKAAIGKLDTLNDKASKAKPAKAAPVKPTPAKKAAPVKVAKKSKPAKKAGKKGRK